MRLNGAGILPEENQGDKGVVECSEKESQASTGELSVRMGKKKCLEEEKWDLQRWGRAKEESGRRTRGELGKSCGVKLSTEKKETYRDLYERQNKTLNLQK